jgi:copper(I)-binding protein
MTPFQSYLLMGLMLLSTTLSYPAQTMGKGKWLKSFVSPKAVQITKAWIREAPPSAQVNAAFLTLTNTGIDAISLLKVKSDRFDHVEMHMMVEKETMMEMKEIFSIAVLPKKSVQLQPGGLHLMLIAPKKRPLKGESIPFRFYFTDELVKTLSLPVITKQDEASYK